MELISNISAPRGLWDDACDKALGSTDSSDLKEIIQIVREDAGAQNVVDISGPPASPTASPELEVCRRVWQAAKAQESEHKDRQWHISKKGDISVGQLYGEIAAWVQKFVAIGDIAAQADPIHVGLPWAAIRLVLLVCW